MLFRALHSEGLVSTLESGFCFSFPVGHFEGQAVSYIVPVLGHALRGPLGMASTSDE